MMITFPGFILILLPIMAFIGIALFVNSKPENLIVNIIGYTIITGIWLGLIYFGITEEKEIKT